MESFFTDLTEKQIRHGVHRSTLELEQAITAYIEAVNEDPKPFRWHKSADEILACIKRFCLKILELAPAQSYLCELRNQDGKVLPTIILDMSSSVTLSFP